MYLLKDKENVLEESTEANTISCVEPISDVDEEGDSEAGSVNTSDLCSETTEEMSDLEEAETQLEEESSKEIQPHSEIGTLDRNEREGETARQQFEASLCCI